MDSLFQLNSYYDINELSVVHQKRQLREKNAFDRHQAQISARVSAFQQVLHYEKRLFFKYKNWRAIYLHVGPHKVSRRESPFELD